MCIRDRIISWSSAGKMGFRGSKKNTPYAAQMAAQDCAKIAFDLGPVSYTHLDVYKRQGLYSPIWNFENSIP